MKTKLLWLLLAFTSVTQAAVPDSSKSAIPLLQPVPQEAQAAHWASEYLVHAHYKAEPLDDAMSEKIFDRYLKSLDPEKMFFVQSDIDKISEAKTKLGDAINNQDLHIPFMIFNLYEQRFFERYAYARSLLKQGFDFNQKESYQFARDKGAVGEI